MTTSEFGRSLRRLATILDSIEVVQSGTRSLGWLIGGALVVSASLAGAGKVASIRRRINELESEAYTDHLTGLKNRRASEKRLQEDLLTAGNEAGRTTERRPPSRSLMLVTADLDDLKQVNDRYGHEAGDRYLQTFARLLEDNLRSGDWVGRMSGDEFLIALWETEVDKHHGEVQTVLRRLIDRTRNTVTELPGGEHVRLSASFGAARYEKGLADSGRPGLYEQADFALLRAKREGKDRIVYA